MRKKTYALVLIAILALSAFIYFYRLDKESLLTDEYLSLYISQKSPYDIIHKSDGAFNPNTIPPLYELILHGWLKLFGVSVFIQRSLSALFGIISVYLLYLLATLIFDRETGLLSALLGSFSFIWFLLFRQDRCYSLLILLTLLSFYIFFSLIKIKYSRRNLFYLAATNILLLYTHYISFFVIALEVVVAFIQWRKDYKKIAGMALACIAAALAYLPWRANLYYDILREPLMQRSFFALGAARTCFTLFKIPLFHFHIHWNPLLAIIYAPFIIKGALKIKKDSPRLFLYLILIFIVPSFFICSFWSTERLRYYAPFLFPFLIMPAYGMRHLNIGGRVRKLVPVSLMTFIITVNALDFADFFNTNINEEWKQASGIVRQISGSRNKKNIFIFQSRYNPPVFSYYFWGPETAEYLARSIASGQYSRPDLSALGLKDKIYVVEDMQGGSLLDQLNFISDGSLIWIFGYHSRFLARNIKDAVKGAFTLQEIALNSEQPQIDVFLLKSSRWNNLSW
ncbi:MAG: glycosyltransferase family 39 protein [Deltaproteobacteria bacterium]